MTGRDAAGIAAASSAAAADANVDLLRFGSVGARSEVTKDQNVFARRRHAQVQRDRVLWMDREGEEEEAEEEKEEGR